VLDVARISARDESRAGWLAGRTGVEEFPDEALIAESSGVPIGTLKTRIRAALRRVRDRASERLTCD
jgi:hypothetical protein